jgi:hypothetical protein
VLEFGYPTDPTKADTDGDGFDDKVESLAGTDPNDPNVRPSENLIINGNFEVPVVSEIAVSWNQAWVTFGPGYAVDYSNLNFPGWMVSTGEIDLMNGAKVSVSPAKGAQFVDIDGRMPGGITQSFLTQVGHKYRVSFQYRGYAPALMDFSLMNEKGFEYFRDTISVSNGTPWSKYQIEFTSTGNTAVVKFASVSRTNWAQGVLIDDVEAFDIANASPTQLRTTSLGNLDSDGDGQTDAAELAAGTDPNSANSRFTLSMSSGGAGPAIHTLATGNGASTSRVMTLTWSSVPGKIYTIEKSTDLISWPVLDTVEGAAGASSTSYEVMADGVRAFYRVGIPNP